MASGAQHYQDAERAFENAKDAKEGSEAERWQMFAANFHARMALAAATALNDAEGGMRAADLSEWYEAAGKGTASAGGGTCPGGC